MKIKIHNPNMPNEDMESSFDLKKKLVLELEFDLDTFTIRQEGKTPISGEISSSDIVSFSLE